MAKDEEALPFEKLDALKREIEALKLTKTAVSKKKASPENVMDTMEKLATTLQDFTQTFEEATEEMKLEEREEELFIKELKPIQDKLDQVVEQNEKIAKGIIAVANMLNSDIPYIKRMVGNMGASSKPQMSFDMPKQSFSPMPPPSFSAPRPMESKPLTGAPMPPPPRLPEKKKKSFSELFK
ncbi:MAG: hypothetical protein WC471_01675 [Candidatus Woesearchaeota archaeon]